MQGGRSDGQNVRALTDSRLGFGARWLPLPPHQKILHLTIFSWRRDLPYLPISLFPYTIHCTLHVAWQQKKRTSMNIQTITYRIANRPAVENLRDVVLIKIKHRLRHPTHAILIKKSADRDA
jgi:hypothetical protein